MAEAAGGAAGLLPTGNAQLQEVFEVVRIFIALYVHCREGEFSLVKACERQ